MAASELSSPIADLRETETGLITLSQVLSFLKGLVVVVKGVLSLFQALLRDPYPF